MEQFNYNKYTQKRKNVTWQYIRLINVAPFIQINVACFIQIERWW